jgi:drug/metabolite transporter (DMT)-like permease
MRVAAVNYLVASPVCFALSVASGRFHLSPAAVGWGALHGAMFAGTYYLLCGTMSVSGMAIATAVVRLSVILPVSASVLIWQEHPSPVQAAGILSCVVALPMIGLRTRTSREVITPAFLARTAALLLGMGVASLSAKAFVESGAQDAPTTYSGVLFGVAAVCCLFVLRRPRWRQNRTGTADGVKLGLVNAGTLVTYMLALAQLPGVLFFPAQAAGGLVLNAIFAAWFWEERFAPRTLAGMAVAAVGLVLVNVR